MNKQGDTTEQTKIDEPKQEAPKAEVKTYTQAEVDAMMQEKKDSIKDEARNEVITAMATKQAEIKQDMLQSATDEFYDLGKWELMKKMADDMVKSGALPKGDNIHTVVMKMQAGREMGMKPLEAINSLYVVNGVINVWGKAVTRRLREHGWSIQYKDDPKECTATVTKGNESYTDTFKFEDAEKSGFTKDNYGKYKFSWNEGANRIQKLRYNVLSKIIKSYLPDVLGAAADIAEVAEDTVPKIQEGEIVDEIDQEMVAQIDAAQTAEDLAKLGKELKADLDPKYLKSFNMHYTRRKNELKGQNGGQQ